MKIDIFLIFVPNEDDGSPLERPCWGEFYEFPEPMFFDPK